MRKSDFWDIPLEKGFVAIVVVDGIDVMFAGQTSVAKWLQFITVLSGSAIHHTAYVFKNSGFKSQLNV